MNPSATFVSWQPVLTDHQAHTLSALAKKSGRRVISYVTSIEDETRKAQGWTDTRVTDVERRLLPQHMTLYQALRRLAQHRGDVHLFCSPFDRPVLILCLLAAVWSGLEVYLVAEPYAPGVDGYFSDASSATRFIKSRLRPLAYQLYGLLLQKKVAGVFAISRLAVSQYRRIGFDSSQVFPFGYFVPSQVHTSAHPRQASTGTRPRLIFVGSLIRRKGLHELLAALQTLEQRGLSVDLDVYGAGDSSSFEFDSQRRYCGPIPFGQAQEVMAGYDALVLPSRHDEWGVVVNEALCAGVPVLCTRDVGASILVERYGAGLTFPASNASAIASAIASLFEDVSTLNRMRQGAREAASAIQPEEAADYMLKVLSMPRSARSQIPSPWYGVAQ